MASRSFNRALRAPLARQFSLPSTQRRTLLTALGNTRKAAFISPKTAVALSLQSSRGMKTIDFAGHKETVYGIVDLKLKAAIYAEFIGRAGGLATR